MEKERLCGLEMGLENKEIGFGVKSRTAEEEEVAMAWCREMDVCGGNEREMDVCGGNEREMEEEETARRLETLDILLTEPQRNSLRCLSQF
jgi:hypothetical protein